MRKKRHGKSSKKMQNFDGYLIVGVKNTFRADGEPRGVVHEDGVPRLAPLNDPLEALQELAQLPQPLTVQCVLEPEQGAEEALGGAEGLEGLGDDEMGGDMGDDLGGDLGGAEEGGEESPLLAAPGRREDVAESDNVSHYEKSSYESVQGRGGDQRKTSGPMRRHIKNVAVPEAPRGKTRRSRTPQGYIADVRFGLEEQKQSIYNKNEIKMIENTMSVRKLVAELEKKEAEGNET